MQEDDIRDLFAVFGPVTIRRMFGGCGIYFRGLIIGLELGGGDLLLKADDISAPDFIAAGATRWTYSAKGKPVRMPYWSVPEAAIDEPEEFARWAQRAYEAALRTRK